MLLLFFLYLGSLAAASPTSGPWSRMNLFGFNAEQLPLPSVPELVKDTPLEGLFPDERHHHEGTIWEIISSDSRFSKLTKAIEFADAAHYFDDEDSHVTFFATPDWALPGHGCDKLSQIDHWQVTEDDVSSFALIQNCHWGDVMSAVEDLDTALLLDDKKKERRKKLFKLLVRAILAYEVLPGAFDIGSLGDNSTYATKLAIPGVLEGQPLRLRVEQKMFPPSTRINFYSKVVYPDVKASNGIIHTVNHPVLPPLSAFQMLFLLPGHFSILTSAIQHVGLTDDIDLRFVDDHHHHHGHKLKGTSLLTLFAPANSAFERLPPKLRMFLFSPWGHHVLRKMLEYHIVPGLVIHSDYQFNKSAHTAPDYANKEHVHYLSRGEIISNQHFRLPTLSDNRTVHTHIRRTEFKLPVPGPDKPKVTKTQFTVNHHDVLIRDMVASNAAIHALDHILDPRRHRHHHDCQDNAYQEGQRDGNYDASWEDWEDWLVQWANSA